MLIPWQGWALATNDFLVTRLLGERLGALGGKRINRLKIVRNLNAATMLFMRFPFLLERRSCQRQRISTSSAAVSVEGLQIKIFFKEIGTLEDTFGFTFGRI